MTVEVHDLVDRFGAAVDRHAAALFVGAGLSVPAGLPGWVELMRPVADKLGGVRTRDLPLLAEYFEQNVPGGRGQLEDHVLRALAKVTEPSEGHRLVTDLGVPEIWTTNYDPLLGIANPTALMVDDDATAESVGSGMPVVIRMHGGFDRNGTQLVWRSRPVITRGDYERYETEHPKLWALLQASYLTRTMLFLGFSFTDPNVELLLRLARRHGVAHRTRHFAVLGTPTEPEELAEHRLRVGDLERNGVTVCELADFAELIPLLRGIRRRARPDRVFVAGSGGPDLRPWFDLAGTVIARHARWQVASLGGDAGWWTTRRVGIQRREDNVYDAEALRLYFRRKDGSPPPEMPERIGTAVFTDEGRHPLVDKVVDGCRAIVVVGGGARTREEVQIAHAAGLGVVPVAASGGAAREVWENACATGLPRLGGYPPPATVWERLADPERDQVEQAVETLLQQAMYW